ncbi:MAG: transposase, partial [Bacillota bacterium]
MAAEGLAADQKGARRTGATLVFTDESGFLRAPLLRTTLAVRGRTPAFEQRASQRDKVSVAAALWKTPERGLVRLEARTYPDQHVNNERYALFLEDLLNERLREVPTVVLQDRGNMHKGEPLEALLDDVPWLLGFEPLPPYAPELNPLEELWDYLKYDELPNFAPL